MNPWIFSLLFCLFLLPQPLAAQEGFAVERLAEGVYAAIAKPGGQASSNAFFVEGESFVIAGGAHLSKAGVQDLTAAVAAVTAKPIRFFILPHHHKGYTAVDFDFPADWQLVMSWQSWQSLNEEARKPEYPAIFYSEGLTLKTGRHLVVLTNMEQGHAEGDSLVYLPQDRILFASDLLYVNSLGYLADGHMKSWAQALDFMADMQCKKVIPGYGPVTDTEGILAYRTYFKAFVSEVLKHIENGESLEQTIKTFSLPQHETLDGFTKFLPVNLERTYLDLRSTLGN